MAHPTGAPFDGDNSNALWGDYEDAPDERPLTIAERVERGIAQGSHLDENYKDRYIVPFPAHLRGTAILDALTGDERRKVYGFRAQGYLPTIYETRDAEPEG